MPVDGCEGLYLLGPCVPVHELLAKLWAAIAAYWSRWGVKRRVIVLPSMVRLSWEAGMNGTILEGSS